jgi:primase-polymerase (primpol)-like protein
MTYADLPEQLTHPSVKRWCTFRLIRSPDKSTKKEPYQAFTHYPAKSNNPATWRNFADCMKSIEYGIGHYPGIALTKDFHLCCIDLDHCINDAGEYSSTALKYIELFKDDAYIERSLSKRGIHIYFWYTGKDKPKNHPENGVEIFTEGQFVIVTGDTLE